MDDAQIEARPALRAGPARNLGRPPTVGHVLDRDLDAQSSCFFSDALMTGTGRKTAGRESSENSSRTSASMSSRAAAGARRFLRLRVSRRGASCAPPRKPGDFVERRWVADSAMR
jgi:hypothetical protein